MVQLTHPLRTVLRALRQRRGVAALEFAITAPFFILMLLAAVDFGRAIDQSIKLETAARAGAQYGFVFPDDTAGIQARITDALQGWPSGSWNPPTVTLNAVACGTGTGTCAQELTVEVTRNFDAIMFKNITVLRGNITLRVS